MTPQLIKTDCLTGLGQLPSGWFHVCITSPPYFGLRSYLKADHPDKPLEIGSERTPEEYVAKMVEVFRGVRRVLRQDGVLFLNLGDSFASGKGTCFNPGGGASSLAMERKEVGQVPLNRHNKSDLDGWGMKSGDLLNMPHRVAEALRADGWYWRATWHWFKKSPMPESIQGVRWTRCKVKVSSVRVSSQPYSVGIADGRRDGGPGGVGLAGKPSTLWNLCPGCPRCFPTGGWVLRRGRWRPTTAVEYVFMLTPGERYFCDSSAVQEASADSSKKRLSQNVEAQEGSWRANGGAKTNGPMRAVGGETRNPRNFLLLSSESYKRAHFATFPSSLVKPFIDAGTSAHGCCPECGACWAPMVEKERLATRPGTDSKVLQSDPEFLANQHGQRLRPGPYTDHNGTVFGNRDPQRHVQVSRVLGYMPTCGCHAGLAGDDLEMIGTPTGSRVAPDPSKETGRAGMNRPRGDEEGTEGMTRYEQRKYAAQLKESPHAEEMKQEAGERFAHYVRMDKSGARPIPMALLETWIGRGWIARVAIPAGEALTPVPCRVLDPFGGSGTVAQVATHMGREATLIELNPDYWPMIEERLKIVPRCLRKKGEKAVKDNGGETPLALFAEREDVG